MPRSKPTSSLLSPIIDGARFAGLGGWRSYGKAYRGIDFGQRSDDEDLSRIAGRYTEASKGPRIRRRVPALLTDAPAATHLLSSTKTGQLIIPSDEEAVPSLLAAADGRIWLRPRFSTMRHASAARRAARVEKAGRANWPSSAMRYAAGP